MQVIGQELMGWAYPIIHPWKFAEGTGVSGTPDQAGLYKQGPVNRCTILVSNDFSLSDDDFTALYKKRWSVEEYHKSLKQNAATAKSPTRTLRTQGNHIFASIMAYVKLET